MSRRTQKVAKLLKKEISVLIENSLPEELGLVTMIDVNVTSDIKEAKIFISCLQKENEKQILSILNKKTIEFKLQLGRKLKLRYTPQISFILDQSLTDINRVEELLSKIKEGE